MFAILKAMNQKDITEIQHRLFAWHKIYARKNLPWRRKGDLHDLYRITVSEIMLQQTNVPKVIEKYKRFLEHFPTIASLAQAQQSHVLRQWQGLGYNRRALNLHKMAKLILQKHGGQFPEREEDLIALPGIGPYTSRAILIFGRNKDIVARDVNVDRVLGRLRSRRALAERTKQQLAQHFLPVGRSRVWHETLMDFASAVCTKQAPQCAHCPLQKKCAAYPCTGDRVHKKKEIGRSEHGKHIPRRIYRGRIIEFLRAQVGGIEDIGRAIKKDWHVHRDQKWLMEVLSILEKEGFIIKRGKKWMLKK